MDTLASLFEPALLIYTLPLCVALFFGLMALVGLLDFEALDFDLDLDADLDLDVDADFDFDVGDALEAKDALGAKDALDAKDAVGGGGGMLQALQFFGLGLIPFSLLLTVWCFVFGWTGLVLVELAGPMVAEMVGAGLATSLALAPVAFVLGVGVTAPVARLLSPLFRDYGEAQGARTLVGKVAVLKTGQVTPTFGSASVKLDGGARVSVSVRIEDVDDAGGDDAPGYGDEVLIYDYDAERNVYLVEPLPHALRDALADDAPAAGRLPERRT